jgi:hypothetical protein
MSRLGPPQFRPGQAVTWVDPDENNLMQPHAGVIDAMETHDGARLYLVRESENLMTLVLEDELQPLIARG